MIHVPPRPWTQETLTTLQRSDLVAMSKALKEKKVQGIKVSGTKPDLVKQLLCVDISDLDRVFDTSMNSTLDTAVSTSTTTATSTSTKDVPHDLIHPLVETTMEKATYEIYEILDAFGSCNYSKTSQSAASKPISETLEPAKALATALRQAMQWQTKLWPSPSTNWQLLQRHVQSVFIDGEPSVQIYDLRET